MNEDEKEDTLFLTLSRKEVSIITAALRVTNSAEVAAFCIMVIGVEITNQDIRDFSGKIADSIEAQKDVTD